MNGKGRWSEFLASKLKNGLIPKQKKMQRWQFLAPENLKELEFFKGFQRFAVENLTVSTGPKPMRPTTGQRHLPPAIMGIHEIFKTST